MLRIHTDIRKLAVIETYQTVRSPVFKAFDFYVIFSKMITFNCEKA